MTIKMEIGQIIRLANCQALCPNCHAEKDKRFVKK